MRISNDSIELNLVVDGPRDASPVLMLHGITMSAATWDFVIPTLSEDYRVFRLDFRGHGDSDRAPGHYGMGSYVADAVAAVEQGVGAPCVVVGHSLGGVTAAALAQQRPDLVRAVLLEDPAIFGADVVDSDAATPSDALADNSLLDVFRLIYTSTPKLQEAGVSTDDLAVLLAASPSPSGPPAGDVYFDDTFVAWAASQLKLDVEVLAPIIDPTAMDPTVFLSGAFDITRPIEVPGVALAGDPAKPDTVLRPAAIDALGGTSPDVKVETMAGVGHMIHDDRTSRDRFVSVLTSLLGEHAAN